MLGYHPSMGEFLTANLSGRVRRELLHGREYLVAPMTLITPGVLKGSGGPLFYPPDEIKKSALAWNHVPIVVYHPKNGSVREPDILNAQGIGLVMRAAADAAGKLTAEGWFDIERTRQVDNRILQAIEAGKLLELSTGLFTDNEPAESGAAGYTHIARNYRPDHLAILPDQVGACSIKDGCGVLVNQRWESLGEILGVENVTKTEGNEELPASAYAYVPDPEKPSTWKLRIDDAGHVGGAIAAIGKGFRGQKANIPSADLPAVKRKIRAAWLKFHKDKTAADLPSVLQNKGGKTMDDTERKAIVDHLVANTCCWEEEDRLELSELTDSQLAKIKAQADKQTAKFKEQEAVFNTAIRPFTDAASSVHTWDSKTGKWQSALKKVDDKTPKTVDEYLAEAPPEVQSAVRNAMEIEARERRELATKLVINIKDAERKAKLLETLQTKPLSDLREMLDLIPQPAANTANYAGAAAGGAGSVKPDYPAFGLPSEYLPTEGKK